MVQLEQNTTQPEATKLMREQTVSARYNLSLPFLRNARWKGNGPRFVKIGVMVYYRPEDVDGWIESLQVSSTTEATAKRRQL